MDSNRDDAQRCLDRAADALRDGDLDKASRFLDKSRRMYPPLGEAHDRLELAIKLERSKSASSSSSTAAGSSSSSSSSRGGGGAKPAGRQGANQNQNQNQGDEKENENEDNTRKATPQMKAAVARVTKLRTKSHYEVLGVDRDADEAAVKKAYRKLALQLHPDRNFAHGADEAFKRVSAAFVTLSDGSKRAHYDQFGTDPDTPAGQQARAQHAFQQGSPVFMNGVRLDDLFGGAGGQPMGADDLFEALFSGAGGMGGTTFHFSSNGMSFGTTTNRAARARARRRRPREDDEVERERERDRGRQQGADHEYANDAASFFERMKPIVYMLFFMFISYLLSDDGSGYGTQYSSRYQPEYTLDQTRYHGVQRTTANGVPFFTHDNGRFNEYKQRRIWKNVDRQALTRLEYGCQQELVKQRDLQYQSRSWLRSQKARQASAKQLEQLQKPHCDEYKRLHAAIHASKQRR